MKGVTLVELLVIISIIVILVALGISTYRVFERETDLNNSAQEIINILRLARNKTIASDSASQYGVYFDTSTTPDQYVLYKGQNYASRDQSADQVFKVARAAEIYEINLGSGQEVVFSRLTGDASLSGNIKIRLIGDTSKNRAIGIDSSGRVFLGSEGAGGLPGQTDSRHTHFDYTRTINTTSETLTLTFQDPPNPDTVQNITINDSLSEGQIDWEGTVTVGGQGQILKIRTHRLNDPGTGTQFSITRDLRYNNKALTITISGDGTGNLISYTAQGQESEGTSIYAGTPQRQ